jgi:hypothetical protein
LRVTAAVYSPSVVALTLVVTLKPSIFAPPPTALPGVRFFSLDATPIVARSGRTRLADKNSRANGRRENKVLINLGAPFSVPGKGVIGWNRKKRVMSRECGP